MEKQKIVSFTNLVAWQAAHELAAAIYKSHKQRLHKNNTLCSQIERSSLSVSSNIAEGFGRSSQKDKQHFYVMARGSLYEVQNQLLLAKDIDEIDKEEFKYLFDLSTHASKLLHRLLRSLRTRNEG
jgi:four helix bundle protein